MILWQVLINRFMERRAETAGIMKNNRIVYSKAFRDGLDGRKWHYFLICDHNLSYRSHKGAKKQLPAIVHSQFTSFNKDVCVPTQNSFGPNKRKIALNVLTVVW